MPRRIDVKKKSEGWQTRSAKAAEANADPDPDLNLVNAEDGTEGKNKKQAKRILEKKVDNKIEKDNKRRKTKGGDKYQVQFVKENQLIEMEVDGQDSEFMEETADPSEDEDDPKVTFNSSARSENNNATVTDSTSDDSDDDTQQSRKFRKECENISAKGDHEPPPRKNSTEKTPDTRDSENIIELAVGHAVAQVQELINKSGLIETAAKLQKQLEESQKCSNTAGNQGNQSKQVAHETVVPRRVVVQEQEFARNRKSPAKGKQIDSSAKKSRIPVLRRKRSSESDITIYDRAVKDGTKRVSTSSEEECEVDTSGEMIANCINDFANDDDFVDEELIVDHFITDQRRIFDQSRPSTSGMGRTG